MTLVNQSSEIVKTNLVRQLQEAARAADAFNGPTADDHYVGHVRFDVIDGVPITSPDCPRDGTLTHNTIGCPYCRLKSLRRAYGVLLTEKGPPQ